MANPCAQSDYVVGRLRGGLAQSRLSPGKDRNPATSPAEPALTVADILWPLSRHDLLQPGGLALTKLPPGDRLRGHNHAFAPPAAREYAAAGLQLSTEVKHPLAKAFVGEC